MSDDSTHGRAMGTDPDAFSGGAHSRWSSRIPTRRVLEAVLWILNTGAQWHMLPQSYPGSTTPRTSWALFKSPASLSSSGDFEIGSTQLNSLFYLSQTTPKKVNEHEPRSGRSHNDVRRVPKLRRQARGQNLLSRLQGISARPRARKEVEHRSVQRRVSQRHRSRNRRHAK